MLRVRQIPLVLALALPSWLVQAAQVQMTSISYGKAPNQRIAIDLNSNTPYRYFVLKNPSRLVVDLTNTQKPTAVQAPPSGQSLLVNARAGVRNTQDLRMVFELNADVSARSSMVAQGKGSRLLIDLTADPSDKKPAAKLATAQPEKKTPKAVQPAELQAKTAVVADGKSKKSKSDEAKPIKPVAGKTRPIIVAIDAGHGGKDVGAQGANGTQEKDVVFAIARRLAARIDAQPGMRAVMTRKGDYFVPLRERVNIARAAKADLFVSIHADAFSDDTAHGASVYTLSSKGASSEAARFLADSENASDLVGGVSLDGRDDTLASVLVDLSQSAAKEASQNVGSKVLRSVKSVGHLHRSQVQKAGFVVLKAPDIPSILVETAFISNPNEEQRLNSRGYQDQMAGALFTGIMSHFRQYAPANTLFAQRSKSAKAARMVAEAVSEPVVAKNEVLASGDADASQSAATSTKTGQHIIKAGETLSEVAQRYGISMRELRLANGMNDGAVSVGQVLQIPPRSS